MISEGSCDTEDWSNDGVNCNNILQYYSFYRLGEHKRCLSKTIKNLTDTKLLNQPSFSQIMQKFYLQDINIKKSFQTLIVLIQP